MRHVARRFACALPLALVACSALTGVGKYDVNDCPKGDCSEAGASSGTSGGDGSAGTDGGSGADGSADTGADVAVDTFTCPAGTSLVTLTVSGTATSVVSEPAGLFLPPNPASACLPVGQIRLRASSGKGVWTCTAGCTESAQDTDQFNFQNPAAGSTITATLQN